jgi:hypothetical protein
VMTGYDGWTMERFTFSGRHPALGRRHQVARLPA